jgi:hypothetical protein
LRRLHASRELGLAQAGALTRFRHRRREREFLFEQPIFPA